MPIFIIIGIGLAFLAPIDQFVFTYIPYFALFLSRKEDLSCSRWILSAGSHDYHLT
jgi:hypothetical protein